ncbi:hypothetical protein OIE63_21325 [Streptomyces sp. NBC_01795]|uniref:hypothetical protein n=1 Tax=unclassified Streptomyces TaxID=2593676 RepID=UPI002DDC81F0|nr:MULTISPECIES: hypothetical protein [unclassified Streptomyces]WSA93835.1 hypothetical protein OIE63_21325 [Streptomyces sp. NBC_01795]WSS13539.1 hypothetical protein OG533_17795 [Streptomyces sp. NBC_01186]
MPGNGPRRAARLLAVVGSLPAVLVLGASRVAAAPKDDPCDLVAGPSREFCKSDKGGSSPSSPSSDPTAATDPLASLAKGCAEAASWTVDKLAKLVNSTTKVDFTNGEFLRQYAVVFAASTILTLTLWLLAVAKRAVRGVPFTEALTEAIGFLWLTVLASAFTPLILYTVVSATDSITEVIASGTSGKTDQFFGTFSEALKKGDDIGGGPIMLIVVSLVSVLAAGVLYLELVVRAALLYVGALLGTAVYAGLVDKNLWGHVRRWAGIMIAVILVKPVIVIVLGLAGALAGGDGPDAVSAVVSGLAIILLAIFASAMIYRFVPGFGDDIVNHRNSVRDPASRAATAVVSSPAALVRQGINTHSARGSQGGAPATASASAKPSGTSVSGGVAAHSSRGGGGGSGGGGGGGEAPSVRKQPAPPTAPASPHSARPPRQNSQNQQRNSGGDRG